MGVTEGPPGGRPTDEREIRTRPARLTGLVAIGSALVLIAGLVPTLIDLMEAADLTPNQEIGAFALICAGVLGAAIAGAGGALARASAGAWAAVPARGETGPPAIEKPFAASAPPAP